MIKILILHKVDFKILKKYSVFRIEKKLFSLPICNSFEVFIFFSKLHFLNRALIG